MKALIRNQKKQLLQQWNSERGVRPFKKKYFDKCGVKTEPFMNGLMSNMLKGRKRSIA